MKSRWLLKMLVGTMLVPVLALAGACSKPTPATETPITTQPETTVKPIVLKYIGFTNETRIRQFGGFWYIDRVKELSNGRLILDYKGGTEVIARDEQFSALRSGVVDLALMFTTNIQPVVPAAYMVHLADHNPDGTRPKEVNDWIDARFRVVGVHYLGQVRLFDPTYVGLKDKIEPHPSALKGMTIIGASAPPHGSVVTYYGATGPNLPTTEIYEALERGLGQGTTATMPDYWTQGWQEQLKYLITPPYKWRSNNSLLMNLDTWNKLPADLRDAMSQAAEDLARRQLDSDLSLVESNMKKWTDAGVQFIEFTGAEREEWTSLYEKISWQKSKESLSPELFEQMERLAKLPPGSPKLPEWEQRQKAQ